MQREHRSWRLTWQKIQLKVPTKWTVLAFTTWWCCSAPYWSKVLLLYFSYIHLKWMNRFPLMHNWHNLFNFTTKSWQEVEMKSGSGSVNVYSRPIQQCGQRVREILLLKCVTECLPSKALYMSQTQKLLEVVSRRGTPKLEFKAKALHKLFTLNILTNTMLIYIKCHTLLKPQNRLRVRNASKYTILGYNKSFGVLIINKSLAFQFHWTPQGLFLNWIILARVTGCQCGFP